MRVLLKTPWEKRETKRVLQMNTWTNWDNTNVEYHEVL